MLLIDVHKISSVSARKLRCPSSARLSSGNFSLNSSLISIQKNWFCKTHHFFRFLNKNWSYLIKLDKLGGSKFCYGVRPSKNILFLFFVQKLVLFNWIWIEFYSFIKQQSWQQFTITQNFFMNFHSNIYAPMISPDIS